LRFLGGRIGCSSVSGGEDRPCSRLRIFDDPTAPSLCLSDGSIGDVLRAEEQPSDLLLAELAFWRPLRPRIRLVELVRCNFNVARSRLVLPDEMRRFNGILDGPHAQAR